jgi:energy-coupling factor transport system ATP-binding protein
MLMAGLLEPASGQVTLDGQPVRGRGKGKNAAAWQKVGMVFQQPEQQLFAETVAEDVAFGPRNLGLDGERLAARVQKALAAVGLDAEEYGGRSPFTLSGGQQRRVAIAGVLALEPEVLVLDEPTAGLDPAGREQILALISAFYRRPGKAVVLVSHNMAEVAALARRVLILHQGRVALEGSPREIFRRGEALRSYGLIPPPLTRLMQALRRRGAPLPSDVLTLAEARDAIMAWIGGPAGGY